MLIAQPWREMRSVQVVVILGSGAPRADVLSGSRVLFRGKDLLQLRERSARSVHRHGQSNTDNQPGTTIFKAKVML